MIRKRYEWKLKRRSLLLGERTLVSGILNVTPDSLFDEGRYLDPDRALVRAVELATQGADYIELGAESMRQGSERVNEGEELRRLVPVLKRLKGEIDIPIAVMTYKAAVAEKAIEYGAEILHDPSGLTLDPDLAKVVSTGDLGLILSHMRGTPEAWVKLPSLKDPAGSVLNELDAAIGRATRSGVLRHRLVIDPGLSFGKRKEQNIALLTALDRLAGLDLPLHIAPSGKAWVAPSFDPQAGALAIAAMMAAVLRGAHIVRMHDVAAARAAAMLCDELLAAMPEPEAARPARLPRPDRAPEDERKPTPVRPPRQVAPPPEPAPEEREAEPPRDYAPPERRPFQGPPRYGGPPRDRGPYKGPPRDRGPYQGPPRDRAPYSGPPRDRGPYSGPPRDRGPYSGPPRDRGPAQGPPRDRGPYKGPPRDRGPYKGPRTGGPGGGGSRPFRPKRGPQGR